jgi:predicted DNA-binding transcriptional regulator AlpA
MATQKKLGERLLGVAEVAELYGISTTAVRQRLARAAMPKPVRLSARLRLVSVAVDPGRDPAG